MMLPHGIPRRRNNGGAFLLGGRTALVMIATAVPAFFLGSLSSLYAGIECSPSNNNVNGALIESKVQQRVKELEQQMIVQQQAEVERQVSVRLEKELVDCAKKKAEAKENDSTEAERLLDEATMGNFAVGLAHTPKLDFTSAMDPGVPLDAPKEKSEDVLILYNRAKALPTVMKQKDATNSIPQLSSKEALENCEYLNLVLTDHSASRSQCIAIMPQYESYHLQKWMRIGKDNAVDAKQPLQLVSRGHQSNGRQQFHPPALTDARKSWDMLKNYLDSLDDVLKELKDILEKIAVNNTVIVMVCNFGQVELLMNFVCSARTRGFDLSNIIVFTTDEQSTELVESMGLTAYFDKRNFGDIPMEAAGHYGDRKFVAMMMAKVICVQLVSMLGYDFLFQDVDIVWFKNPLEYFTDTNNPAHQYDIFFQDDGGHSIRYAPYSANSGFYFVRHNERTRHFLTTLLNSADLVLKTDSHQQALIAVLNEHVSLYGLKVKVLSRDTEEFPGGYQWNQKTGKFMRAFFNKEVHPWIFHMSWTLNKDNKLLYFRQMGEWFVQDKCINQTKAEIGGEGTGLPSTCCSAEPLVSCHYRDKPSVIPCKDSPPIDKGRPSFW